MRTTQRIFQLNELPQLVREIRQAHPPARIFALSGELGAGKTTFVSEFCQQLGVQDAVSSPTFGIVNEYQLEEEPVFHIDCYRLRNIEEALDIGIEDYLAQAAYCFIEWPDVIAELLPADVVSLHFHHHTAADGTPCRLMSLMTPSYE